MSNTSNALVPFYQQEDQKREKSIFVKESCTREIYHGSELKFRIEMRGVTYIAPVKNDSPAIEKYAEFIMQEHKEPSSSKGQEKIKTYKIHKPNEAPGAKRNYCLWFVNIVVVILIAILCERYRVHVKPFSIDGVQTALHSKILNQNSAITTTIQSLEQLQNQSAVKILTCLVGPTGVGKTHLINILGQQISPDFIEIYNRLHLPELYDTKSTLGWKLHKRLHASNFFIIVLDDLTIKDLEILEKFVEMTFSIRDTGVLVLTVFNIETEGCLNHSQGSRTGTNIIKWKLRNICRYFYYSHFNYLNEDDVRMWLEDALLTRKVPLHSLKEIIHRLLEGQDIRCHGLKGLQAKVLLEDT